MILVSRHRIATVLLAVVVLAALFVTALADAGTAADLSLSEVFDPPPKGLPG